jgi:hypothetical protein
VRWSGKLVLGDTLDSERVLFFGTQFSNLSTAVDTPARAIMTGDIINADARLLCTSEGGCDVIVYV